MISFIMINIYKCSQGLLDRVSSLPAKKDLGRVEVRLERLVEAWKPEFERCLSEVLALLPRLADKTFQAST